MRCLKRRWEAIEASGELRRMNRAYIHFATQTNHMRQNTWANLNLKLDLAQALQEGHKFFLSANSVLLTEGPIPLKYLKPINKADLPSTADL